MTTLCQTHRLLCQMTVLELELVRVLVLARLATRSLSMSTCWTATPTLHISNSDVYTGFSLRRSP